ncbi:MAG: hypothetical protein ACXWPM_02210 [Bdellovibrionota bacterium]
MRAIFPILSLGGAMLALTACQPLQPGCTAASFTEETTGLTNPTAVNDPAMGNQIAQSFQVNAPVTVNSASLKLVQIGQIATAASSGKTLTLTIESESGTAPYDNPSGTILATSNVDVFTIPNKATFVTFSFVATTPLYPLTQYWLKLFANWGPSSSTNQIQWLSHDNTNDYLFGHALTNPSSSVNNTGWSTGPVGAQRDQEFIVNCVTTPSPSPSPSATATPPSSLH